MKHPEKRIKVITIVLALIYILLAYNIWIELSLTQFTFHEMKFLIPMVLFPLGLFFFWNHKRSAWFLVSGILVWMVFETLFSTVHQYVTSSVNDGILHVTDGSPSYEVMAFKLIVLGIPLGFLFTLKIGQLYRITTPEKRKLILLILSISAVSWLQSILKALLLF